MQMQQATRKPRISLPKDPVERAWVALQHNAPALLEQVEAKLKQARFPALEAYDVLWAVEREGPLRQRDLASHMLIARYSISRLIDRMEQDGLVERSACPEDARGQLIHATPEGRKLRKAMWGVYGKAMREALAPLTDKEKRQLAALLAKLA